MSRETPKFEVKRHKYQDRIPVWSTLSFKRRRQAKQLVQNALTVVGLLIILFPLFWMFSTAFRPDAEMYTRPIQLLPSMVTLDRYATILFDLGISTYYYNSIVIAAGVVVITVIASTLGGYGLSRIDIPQKQNFARGILIGYMFPSILLSIPMFIFWRQLGLINTLSGVILAESAKTIPVGLWFMWKYFQTIPYSLEESAMVAGATPFRAFYEIALPRAKPGVIAIAILAFAVSWDEFTIPKVLLPDQAHWPITVGLFSLTEQQTVLWGEMMAASSLALIPSFLFVVFLQNYLLEGFRY